MVGLSGCREDDPEPIVCSCDGTGKSELQDLELIAVSTTDGYKLLSPFGGFYLPCEEIPAQYQQDGQMLRADLMIKATCSRLEEPAEYYALQNFSQVQSLVESVDSLFEGADFKITIIKSEDYGYSEGFGYTYTNLKTGFKIVQATIQVIGGNVPFETAIDAFKIAVLVAHKNNSDGGLPSVSREELEYLQVIL